MMRENDTNCCGLGEVSGFPYDYQQPYPEGKNFKIPRAYHSARFATLTQAQSRAQQILTQRGWTKVGEFRNRNTGNTVSMFVKGMKKPKACRPKPR